MDPDIHRREKWVRLYEECGDAGLVCRRCGISRPTLRKWLRRFAAEGIEGLASRSRRPLTTPRRKVGEQERSLVLGLRRRGLGARRIKAELRLQHDLELSLATIHKELVRAHSAPLRQPRRPAEPKRYSRPVPGDRVQMDTMKIAPGLYQYTAVDDCTRWRVLAIYGRRSSGNTLKFLERVVEEMPFPIQHVQTDRGTEFFAERVQRHLKSEFIKFRPTPPRSPHLNGKVERSQSTDRAEFWSQHEPTEADLEARLEEWQFDYNWRRPHGALGGRTPAQRLAELGAVTPLREDVALVYDVRTERLQLSNWTADRALAALTTNFRQEGGLARTATKQRRSD